MNNGTTDVLCMLQQADSFFPSGATSTSSGLETLVNDGVVGCGEELESFIRGQIRWRWLPFERLIVVASIRCCCDNSILTDLDHQVHAQSLVAEEREGSIRTGRALLRIHADMNTVGAADYQGLVRTKVARGHNPVIQGLVWGRLGIPEAKGELMSAHTFSIKFLGASIRLGIIGHTEAQSILGRLHREILDGISRPCPHADKVTSFCPEQEIGLMRHERLESRLFIN